MNNIIDTCDMNNMLVIQNKILKQNLLCEPSGTELCVHCKLSVRMVGTSDGFSFFLHNSLYVSNCLHECVFYNQTKKLSCFYFGKNVQVTTLPSENSRRTSGPLFVAFLFCARFFYVAWGFLDGDFTPKRRSHNGMQYLTMTWFLS